FRFEAKAAAALNHPNIVQILEIGQEQGIVFIAMQLVRGPTLAEQIGGERLPPAQAVALLLKLCEAVGYAHKLRLLHLDLKPSNVLIDERGEPLVADFGLARRMDDTGQVEAQEVSGTPAYMAPEQVLIKQFHLSAATDIYALGAILYEMLCGDSPHGRGAPAEVMQRALPGQIRPPSQFLPRPPRDLEAIAMKCLALRAADRYASLEALAEDLRHYANGLPVSVRRPGLRERMQRWYGREPRFAVAVGSIFVLTLLSAAAMGWLYRDAERERAGTQGLLDLAVTLASPPQGVSRNGLRRPHIDCLLTQWRCIAGNLAGMADANFAVGDYDMNVMQAEGIVTNMRRQLQRYRINNPEAYLPDVLIDVTERSAVVLRNIDRADVLLADENTDAKLFGFTLHNDWYVNTRISAFFGFEIPALQVTGQTTFRAPPDVKNATAWQAQILAESCDPDAPECKMAIQRFREIDPGNAAAWMLGLRNETPTEAFSHLQRAASAPRLDNHAAEIIDAAATVAGRLSPHLPDDAKIGSAGLVLQIWNAIPPLKFPIGYCRQAIHKDNGTAALDACVKVFAKVRAQMRPRVGDELTAAIVELRMASDPTMKATAWQRYRDIRWVYSSYVNLPQRQRDTGNDEIVRMYRDKGELAYLKFRLVAAGIPLAAPADFVTAEPISWAEENNPRIDWR
ncbi:MAG: serine/threonine protein kinase, partial [Proteobacteria bacterium]|nr:serine/threonine protein kinase [Pseudomonadota bacterium]